MHSSTSSEGSRLVRIVVPYAQTRVAIETHSRANGAKHEAKFVLFHSLVVDSTFEQNENIAITR